MRNVTIGEFKARFSHLLNLVKQGEEIVISYGRRKEKVAIVIPYRREGDGDEILTLTAGFLKAEVVSRKNDTNDDAFGSDDVKTFCLKRAAM